MGPNEQRLADIGLEVEEDELQQAPDEGLNSVVLARPFPNGDVEWWAYIRAGCTAEERETFAGWAFGLVTRFSPWYYEGGIDEDGWQERPDGMYQLWGRLHWFPEV